MFPSPLSRQFKASLKEAFELGEMEQGRFAVTWSFGVVSFGVVDDETNVVYVGILM